MKNTLKKVLCTALAAVSLSAIVTVPSSLNAPKSDNAIVNVMEADAAEKVLYEGYITEGKKYYTRKTPSKKDDSNVYKKGELEYEYVLEKYMVVKVYEEKNNFVRISPSNEKDKNGKKRERWVYKPRVFKAHKNEFTICNAGRHPANQIVRGKLVIKNSGEVIQQTVCLTCGNHWEKDINKDCKYHNRKYAYSVLVLQELPNSDYDIVGKYYYCKKCKDLISLDDEPNLNLSLLDFDKWTLAQKKEFLKGDMSPIKNYKKKQKDKIHDYVTGCVGYVIIPFDLDAFEEYAEQYRTLENFFGQYAALFN